MTPLHWASDGKFNRNSSATTELLIRSGADVNAKDIVSSALMEYLMRHCIYYVIVQCCPLKLSFECIHYVS